MLNIILYVLFVIKVPFHYGKYRISNTHGHNTEHYRLSHAITGSPSITTGGSHTQYSARSTSSRAIKTLYINYLTQYGLAEKINNKTPGTTYSNNIHLSPGGTMYP